MMKTKVFEKLMIAIGGLFLVFGLGSYIIIAIANYRRLDTAHSTNYYIEYFGMGAVIAIIGSLLILTGRSLIKGFEQSNQRKIYLKKMCWAIFFTYFGLTLLVVITAGVSKAGALDYKGSVMAHLTMTVLSMFLVYLAIERINEARKLIK